MGKMLQDLNILDSLVDIFLIFSPPVCQLVQHLVGDVESVLPGFNKLWINYHPYRYDFYFSWAFAHPRWRQALGHALGPYLISVYP